MRIMCVDMDSFFASVEMAANPILKQSPMAVAGSSERSVILSASYSARAKGIRTGQSVQEARKIYPDLRIVKASGKKYTYVSSQIAQYLLTISPTARMSSIDEAFIDITDLEESPAEIAYKIKTWLKTHVGVTGSVGVGESYLLAKMASNVKKPDGYYEVLPGQRLTFMDGFSLRKIWGIGRRTVAKLNALGLYKPSEVRAFGEEKLTELFGIPGAVIYRSCCGLDKNEEGRREDEPLKSISHAITTPEDVQSREIAHAYLLQLSEAVSRRARNRMYSGRTVSLTVREGTEGRKSYSFRQNLGYYTSATHHIYEAVKRLFEANVPSETPIRLFGVGLDNLVHGGTSFSNMEDMLDGKDERNSNIYKALDEINNKYDNGLIRGSVLKIGFREPKGISFSFKKDTYWRSVYKADEGE